MATEDAFGTMFRGLRNRGIYYSMAPRPLNSTLKAYSVALMPGQERHAVDHGGKIILPPSCLELLTRLNTTYPMLFSITNPRSTQMTHCGVLEFIAEEGRCYMPHWMMRNLSLEEGHNINLKSVTLPVATFSKFEPQSVDFLEVSDPKAILENCLRNFACLTTGDTIAIPYNDKLFELRVLETKPGPAVTIIECDMEVDFAPPVGYVEPVPGPRATTGLSEVTAESSPNYAPIQGFSAFVGSGNRLDGKTAADGAPSPTTSPTLSMPTSGIRGIPDYDYEVGNLQFVRDFSCFQKKKDSDAEKIDFQPFAGTGASLGRPKKSSKVLR